MNEMKTIAICIPTYNRSDVLQDTFSFELDACRDLGIDIYLYDSSTDGKTFELVQKLGEYPNLHHVSIDSSVKLDEKVVMIYQLYHREKKHDYLWLVGDSVGFSKELLRKVISVIQNAPTMVLINNEDIQHLGDKSYNSAPEVFRDLFWKSSLWGSVIIQESLYSDMDWSPYVEKFVGTDQISVGLHWYRVADVSPFSAELLSVRKDIDMRKSKLKKYAWWKEKECGSETTFRVWAKGLINVVDALPYTETDKFEALKNQRLFVKNFNWLSLCRSRKDRIYNMNIYKKYGEGIKRLTQYPDSALILIAKTPPILMKIFVKIVDLGRKSFVRNE